VRKIRAQHKTIPRESVGTHVGQYLKGTADKGLILKPLIGDQQLNIDCYIDADFAGLWGYEDKQEPSCVKSRTGFVSIFIANCPVVWSSKLQSDIAASTGDERSYPFLNLAKEIATGVGMTEEEKTMFKTTVWEDNNGWLTLAKMEPGRMTPRSKHYGIRYHWYRSKLIPNKIEVERIGTDKQRVDFVTKTLRTLNFQNNRRMTCGW
jgi:hypothetical protein